MISRPMAKTREIKGRIKAVSNIQRITKTMQMIATARFQASQKRATAAKPFTQKIAELVAELAATAGNLSHPLLKKPEPAAGRDLLLVITSNRGLCGGYNANILRTAMGWIRQQGDRPFDLEVVGRKGLAYFRFAKVPVTTFHSQFTDKPAFEEVERLATQYMDAFTSGKYDSVNVVYMSFQSASRQTPIVLNLLPLRDPTAGVQGDGAGVGVEPGQVDYDFSPTPDELLAELLPMTVKTQLFQCFNEAVVGEQIARMVAMKAATDSAGKMRKELVRRFNRARQAAITTELSEIIAGAAALD